MSARVIPGQHHQKNQKAGDPGLFYVCLSCPARHHLYISFTAALRAFTPALPPAFHTAAIPTSAVLMDGFMDALYLFLIAFFSLTALALIQGLELLGEKP